MIGREHHDKPVNGKGAQSQPLRASSIRQDADLGINLRQFPEADTAVFPERLTLDLLFAEYTLGKDLALIHGEIRTRLQRIRRSRERSRR